MANSTGIKPPHKCMFDKEEVERVPLHNKDGATVAFDVITHKVCSGCKVKHPYKRERVQI